MIKATKGNVDLVINNNDLNGLKAIFETNSNEALTRLCSKMDIYFNLFIGNNKKADYDVRKDMLVYLENTHYAKNLYDNHHFFHALIHFMFIQRDEKYLNFLHAYFNSQHFAWFLNDKENESLVGEMFSSFASELKEESPYYQKLGQHFLHNNQRNTIINFRLLTEFSLITQLTKFNQIETLKDCFQEQQIIQKIKMAKNYDIARYPNNKECLEYIVSIFGRDCIYQQSSLFHSSNQLDVIQTIFNQYPPSNQKEKDLILTLSHLVHHSDNINTHEVFYQYATQCDNRIFNQELKTHLGDKGEKLLIRLYQLKKYEAVKYWLKKLPVEELLSTDDIIYLINTSFAKEQNVINKMLINELIKKNKINDECFSYTSYPNTMHHLRLVDYMCASGQEVYLNYLLKKNEVNIDENTSCKKPEDYWKKYESNFIQARIDREKNILNHSLKKDTSTERKKMKI